MSPKVLHFYIQMTSSLEKLIIMKKELKIKLKNNKRIKETSCKKKRTLSRRGRLTIVSTKQLLCVLSKIRLLHSILHIRLPISDTFSAKFIKLT